MFARLIEVLLNPVQDVFVAARILARQRAQVLHGVVDVVQGEATPTLVLEFFTGFVGGVGQVLEGIDVPAFLRREWGLSWYVGDEHRHGVEDAVDLLAVAAHFVHDMLFDLGVLHVAAEVNGRTEGALPVGRRKVR